MDKPRMIPLVRRIWRHRWLDERRLRREITPELLERLTQRVAASEQRHSGQIRLCIETALPLSYLRRGATARERAVMLFGKLRCWDTEHNNGVLIYLLQAEHAIEIVADRGIDSRVPDADWAALAARMSAAFHAGLFEDGLTQALDETSALLAQHFPRDVTTTRRNELPDAPVLL